VIAATELCPEKCNAGDLNVEIISDDEMKRRYPPESIELALGIGSIWPVDEHSVRRRVVKTFSALGYRFTGLRHPAAWISPFATIAPTAQIHAGAIVQVGSFIGEHSIINTRASVDHDANIEEFCHIGPGATLSGNVGVGNGAHIGTGACVIQGVSLGKGCFVAAGATVVNNVQDGAFVRGVPARGFMPKV
jgi:UDP-perosamine 4-acetyltransferase